MSAVCIEARKKESDPQELKLQAVVSSPLGIELGSLGLAAGTFTCGNISSAAELFFSEQGPLVSQVEDVLRVRTILQSI